MNYQTAESVTLGHPDKAADFIADSILDACLKEDPDSRVACEVMLSHEVMMVAGEITTKAKLNYQAIAEEAVKTACGSVPESFVSDIVTQSPDISQAVDKTDRKKQGAGDQGIVYGYATKETIVEQMPLATVIAHDITNLLISEGPRHGIGPDGKSQVTVAYNDDGTFHHVETVVVSVQHKPEMPQSKVEEIVKVMVDYTLKKYDRENWWTAQLMVNPSGRFVLGGYKADTGLTGRKLMVDTYGGLARHGGGALSGKDPSKTDRSGAYMARWVAKAILSAGLAERVEVGIAYAIGKAEPVMVSVDTFKTWHQIPDRSIAEAIKKAIDLTPEGIEKALNLKNYKAYKLTAAHGHFGRPDYPWELNCYEAGQLIKDAALKLLTESQS